MKKSFLLTFLCLSGIAVRNGPDQPVTNPLDNNPELLLEQLLEVSIPIREETAEEPITRATSPINMIVSEEKNLTNFDDFCKTLPSQIQRLIRDSGIEIYHIQVSDNLPIIEKFKVMQKILDTIEEIDFLVNETLLKHRIIVNFFKTKFTIAHKLIYLSLNVFKNEPTIQLQLMGYLASRKHCDFQSHMRKKTLVDLTNKCKNFEEKIDELEKTVTNLKNKNFFNSSFFIPFMLLLVIFGYYAVKTMLSS